MAAAAVAVTVVGVVTFLPAFVALIIGVKGPASWRAVVPRPTGGPSGELHPHTAAAQHPGK